MPPFDYATPAELFPRSNRMSKQRGVGYKRFDTAAEAIRYAIEVMPPEMLGGAFLEVDEERFDNAGMRALYADAAYPLERSGLHDTPPPIPGMPPVTAV
jgi:hypothetical protein